jgi:hypothetical protein
VGVALQEVYAELSPSPIAAASLGQVYKGRLKTGEQVAVKVQRPYVLETVTIDLFILRSIGLTINDIMKGNVRPLLSSYLWEIAHEKCKGKGAPYTFRGEVVYSTFVIPCRGHLIREIFLRSLTRFLRNDVDSEKAENCVSDSGHRNHFRYTGLKCQCIEWVVKCEERWPPCDGAHQEVVETWNLALWNRDA